MKKKTYTLVLTVIPGIAMGAVPAIIQAHSCDRGVGCPEMECPSLSCSATTPGQEVWMCVMYPVGGSWHCCECKYEVRTCEGPGDSSSFQKWIFKESRNHHGPGICAGSACTNLA